MAGASPRRCWAVAPHGWRAARTYQSCWCRHPHRAVRAVTGDRRRATVVMTRRGMRDGADTGCRTAVPADHTLAPPWHGMDVATVEARLDTTTHGLSRDEAAARLRRFGPEPARGGASAVVARPGCPPVPEPAHLHPRRRRSAVTVLLGEFLDAGVIAVVLVLNAVIGFAQERKAETAVRALMGLVVSHARVIRSGEEWDVDSGEIVPGDVVLLEPGARVPADLRLVSVNGLQVDESLLTGESAPVAKGNRAGRGSASARRPQCAWPTPGRSSPVGRGAGAGRGHRAATELGAIAGLMRREEVPPTPLQQRMDRFAKAHRRRRGHRCRGGVRQRRHARRAST